MRGHRWAADHGGGRSGVLAVRRPGPPRVPAGRRRRAHPAGEAGEPPVCCGGAFQSGARRYERQGVLVEEEALAAAEQACLADEEARRRRRERADAGRADEDETFHAGFASAIVQAVSGLPARSGVGHRPPRRHTEQRTGRQDRSRPCAGRARRHAGGRCVGPPPRHRLRRAADDGDRPGGGSPRGPTRR